MAKHHTHSIAFKRQVVQEYFAGETRHGLARRHDLSRTLIRIWVNKYEAGAFDEDAEAVDTIQEYEARIRRRRCSATPETARATIQSSIFGPSQASCRLTPLPATGGSTSPVARREPSRKRSAGRTAGASFTSSLISRPARGAARARRRSRHWRWRR